MDAALDQAETLGDRLVEEGTLSPRERSVLAEGIETLRVVSFEDRDFDLLFQGSVDGAAEDPELAAQFGFANLEFASWFVSFT